MLLLSLEVLVHVHLLDDPLVHLALVVLEMDLIDLLEVRDQ